MRRNEHRNRLVRKAATGKLWDLGPVPRGAARELHWSGFSAMLEMSQSFASPSPPKIFYLLKALRTKPFLNQWKAVPKRESLGNFPPPVGTLVANCDRPLASTPRPKE